MRSVDVKAPLLVRWFNIRSMVRKLTKAEREVDEQMLAIIEWAADHPKHWHNIGPLPASKQAAAMLEQRGVIEIWWETNQYRLKKKDK
jgi:hypothetical protein